MTRARSSTSGTLANKPLAHLLVYMLEKELTGTLELARADGAEHATIVVSRGEVTRIRTSATVVYLGSVMYEMGFIDAEELNASLLELSKQRRPHGQILVARGSITPSQLGDAVREHALRKLVHLYSFGTDAVFTFHPDLDALAGYGGDGVIATDPSPAIWRGIRDFPSPEHEKSVLARIGASPCRLARAARLERFRLQPDELQAVECLRIRPLTIAELAASGIVPARTVDLLAYCLAITHQIEIVDAKAPPVRASVQEMQAVRASTPKMAAVMRTPSDPMVPAMRPPTPPISFNMRVASPFPPRLTPAGTERVTAELAARMQQLRERAVAIAKEDFFQRLSIARDATPQQAHDAFEAVKRRWEPEALPHALEAARADHERVFAALVEARDTLTDPRKREEYVRRLKSGQALLPPTAKEDVTASGADNEYDGAKACLARGDLELAERLARRAHKAKPTDADALALLAWIEASKPSNQSPEALMERIVMLSRAIKQDEECEAAFFFRAELHKRVENHAAAMKDLRHLLTLNPGHVDAERELRIYEMRIRNNSITMQAVRSQTPAGGTKPPAGGLLDRLLKK